MVRHTGDNHQNLQQSELISVIVPVYKVENYLKTCVHSILAQTYKNFELILVDDGSPDRCPEICEELAAEDSRIRVIHRKNGGLSAARNTGTKSAEGGYLTYIDSDDSVEPLYLQTLYEALKKNDADVSVVRSREVYEGRSPEKQAAGAADERLVLTGRDAVKRLLEMDETFMITAWGKLYSRKLAGLLHYPEGKLHEDEYVTYKVYLAAGRVVLSDYIGYRYLQREGSIVHEFSEKNLEVLEAFREAPACLAAAGEPELQRLAVKRLLRILRYDYLKAETLEPAVRRKLYDEWRSEYKKNRLLLYSVRTSAEKIADALFAVSPKAYGAFRKLTK